MRNKHYFGIATAFALVLFAAGYVNRSSAAMISALCTLVFLWIQYRLEFGFEKSEAEQRKLCKSIGYFLLIPSIGVIVIGILTLFNMKAGVFPIIDYVMITLSAVLSVCLVIYRAGLRWYKNPAGRFLRMTSIAALSAPMSSMITLLLCVIQAENAAILGSMTCVILGGAAFLVSANMILVSIYGYRSTGRSIRILYNMLISKKLIFTRISIMFDVFGVAGKSILSVISASFFVFANALYSSGIGMAQFVALKMHMQTKEKQIASYRLVGIILSIASLCYVIYSVRLFFGGKTGVYSMYVALVIALYTFVEFGINIRDAFRLRKNNALAAKALRAVSLASTLICFVLTQTAIMSFAAEGDHSVANAVSGIVFGGLATLTGFFIIVDNYKQKIPSDQ
jgi:hypothetical protein